MILVLWVLHRQPTIVLRLLHHALVLAQTKATWRNIARSRYRAGLEGIWFPCINPHCCLVTTYVTQGD